MNTVIYHKNCPDGFAAALILYLINPESQFIAASYGDPFPEMSNTNISIVDFSYPSDVLLKAAERGNKILVLDHHKSAQKDLESLIGRQALPSTDSFLEVKFDLNHCGAYMTWQYFVGNEVPDWIKYIEDRDLWLWALQGSREFSAALASYPRDFAIWTEVLKANHRDLQQRAMMDLISEGKAILRYQRQVIEQQSKNARWGKLPGCEDVIPIVNATALGSEVGEWLREEHKEAPYNASYRINGKGEINWSLRAGNSRWQTDCGQVAKLFGGGGHPGAAGFSGVTLDQITWVTK